MGALLRAGVSRRDGQAQHIGQAAGGAFGDHRAHPEGVLTDDAVGGDELPDRSERPVRVGSGDALSDECFAVAAGEGDADALPGGELVHVGGDRVLEGAVQMRQGPHHVDAGDRVGVDEVEAGGGAQARRSGLSLRLWEEAALGAAGVGQLDRTPTRSQTKMRVSPPLMTPGMPRGP